jgi:phage pi2 protein 07
MDWLFIPLGNGIKWSFQFLEMASMKYNLVMIAAGTGLTIYWVMQMLKNKQSEDKGVFRPKK